jgi:hypothetical protein
MSTVSCTVAYFDANGNPIPCPYCEQPVSIPATIGRAQPDDSAIIGDAIGRAVAESITDAEHNAERHGSTITESDDGSITITYTAPKRRSYGEPESYTLA